MGLTTALLCLATNIYFEARGESLLGQYAVALVTMNRAGNDQSKVCDVVLKPKQFSWTTRLVKTGNDGVPVLEKQWLPKEERAWRLAKAIAQVTLDGQMRDFTKGAVFYHADSVSPIWRKSLQRVAVIGRHKFYKSI